MFYLHPIFQTAATLLGLYALWQGWQRIKSRHLGREANFSWAGHSRLGRLAMLLWLIGAAVAIVYIGYKGMLFRPGPHVFVGWAFIAPALFVFIAGNMLVKSGGRKKYLAMAHGAAGFLLVLAALFQCATGILMLFG